MPERFLRPPKNAMQWGTAITKQWRLEYEPEQPQVIEPLMGWTSSGDMRREVTLFFDTKQEAVGFCEREAIALQVIEPKEPERRPAAYAENVCFRRGGAWTPS